jgi:predicted transcriptional regulator
MVVSANVDTEIKHAIDRLARANDRSFSAEVRVALRRHLALEGASTGSRPVAAAAAVAGSGLA